MIIVKLIGGLGNQLFQYAAGRRMSMEQKEKLVLDISAFQDYTLRTYALSPFRINARIATAEEMLRLKKNFSEKMLAKLFKNRRLISKKKFSLFKKSHTILETDDYGHWDNEKYFHSIENILRKEITLKEPQGENYERVLKKITTSNSVSLHVRRTDYSDSKNAKIYAECSPEYYASALKYISEKTGVPELFIFSDDADWVKKNMKIDYPAIFIADEHFSDCQELMLMASCKHNIIANSTFSWWGAWLNTNPDKIVVAPEKWFVDETNNTSEIVPSTWIKL